MRTTAGKNSPTLPRGIASRKQIALAGMLLFGVMVMGYGYFQQNKASLYIGIVVIVAGVLNGVVQIVLPDRR